ncbi:hypothetical protein ACFFHH_09545 [Cytobacillus solani]|uniref:LysM domain-containing protein n=1 Tax=Cytobacillus solani TaxID=1637975 RepID=A0A0Q3QQU5_9BACI|nr:hypothetical protein [Cytobacillus solani]KOP83463.1 hypothetical protein AMS60_13800 [Bacillus sp. FJAT-21945]KQL20537.1 hypothetical protein AN957_19415 [Cytobacillus solani]USK53768.1 hypothetical protein LIS82_19460 [Cytobacillus solani]
MKRLVALLLAALTIFVIYYDLSKGTLPVDNEQSIEATSMTNTAESFFEKKVNPGETVLSIIEQKMKGPLPVSITDVISDFSNLNSGLKPEELKYGETYKFPLYSSKN